MAKKELTFIFENPNSSEETKQLLKKILLDKLLTPNASAPVKNACGQE